MLLLLSFLDVQVAIIPEDVFKRVGYTNSRNETVLCCDAQSIKVSALLFP